MRYQVLKFCEGCMEDVLSGEIEFTIPTCISVVGSDDCDNIDVDTYDERIKVRGLVELG